MNKTGWLRLMKLNGFALGAMLTVVDGVWAQSYKAPAAKGLGEGSTTMEWVMTFVFLVGCLIVAFKPAKRSNLK